MIFPEIDYDRVDQVARHGHHDRDDGQRRRKRRALLDAYGFPFRREVDTTVEEAPKRRNRAAASGRGPARRK